MSEKWDQYAENWDSNEDVISYSEKAYRALKEVVDIEGIYVLDFGCGTGLLAEKLATKSKKVVAIDSSEKMISVLNRKDIVNVNTLSTILSEETIRDTPLLSEKFDLIVASSVCAFVSDYEETLRMLKGILKPNGLFVQWDWMEEKSSPGFGFSVDRIDSAYSHIGFEPKSIREVFTVESKGGNMKVVMGVAKNA